MQILERPPLTPKFGYYKVPCIYFFFTENKHILKQIIIDMNNHLTIWNQMINKKLCLTMVLKILFVSLTGRAQATGEKNLFVYNIDNL